MNELEYEELLKEIELTGDDDLPFKRKIFILTKDDYCKGLEQLYKENFIKVESDVNNMIVVKIKNLHLKIIFYDYRIAVFRTKKKKTGKFTLNKLAEFNYDTPNSFYNFITQPKFKGKTNE